MPIAIYSQDHPPKLKSLPTSSDKLTMKWNLPLLLILSFILTSCGNEATIKIPSEKNVAIDQLKNMYAIMYCGTLKKTRSVPQYGGQGVAEMKVSNNLSSQSLTIEPSGPNAAQFVQGLPVGSFSYVCAFGTTSAGSTIENPYVFQAKEVVPTGGNTVRW